MANSGLLKTTDILNKRAERFKLDQISDGQEVLNDREKLFIKRKSKLAGALATDLGERIKNRGFRKYRRRGIISIKKQRKIFQISSENNGVFANKRGGMKSRGGRFRGGRRGNFRGGQRDSFQGNERHFNGRNRRRFRLKRNDNKLVIVN